MSITSFSFLIFLGVVIGVYYLLPDRYQWMFLLAANVVFYLFAGPKYIVYLLITVCTTWYGAKRIGVLSEECAGRIASVGKSEEKALKQEFLGRKRHILILVLLINFGILGVLKYFQVLFKDLAALCFPQAGEALAIRWILPLGISFYIFQSMGYLIDVYRGKYKPEQNFFKYALFASFFPQMVQGPIGRFEDLAPQLYAGRRFDYEKLTFGAQLMLWGFFKKLVIADRIANLTGTIFVKSETYSGVLIVVGMLAYTLQIYADFSGGIDIVTGAAETLGIHLAPNFERPNFAQDVPEFWRRWHITLGAWFRDYVFYPLSLSRFFTQMRKKTRKIFGNYIGKMIPIIIPQFIVFFLVGVWHGANWKYCVFGFYHGILIVATILLEDIMAGFWKKLHVNTEHIIWRCLRILCTFILVAFGRVITSAPDLSDFGRMVASIFTHFDYQAVQGGAIFGYGIDKRNCLVLAIALLIVFCASLLQEKGIVIRKAMQKMPLPVRWLGYLFLLFAVLIFGIYGIGYNASDFVYRGF